jgi:hypothetical protein
VGARTGNGAFGPWRAYPVLPQVPSLTHTKKSTEEGATPEDKNRCQQELTHRGMHTRGERGEKKQQKQQQPGTVAAPGAAVCGTVRGGGELAPCSSTRSNHVHMREHLYPEDLQG